MSEAFPHRRFVVVHPEVEGRCTLLSVEGELQRLLSQNVTHVLLVAKGSTDLHLAWLDSQGAACGQGCSTSAVHCVRKGAPSSAKELFRSFITKPANAALLDSLQNGRGAVVFAGARSSRSAATRPRGATTSGPWLRRTSRAAARRSSRVRGPAQRGVLVGSRWARHGVADVLARDAVAFKYLRIPAGMSVGDDGRAARCPRTP